MPTSKSRQELRSRFVHNAIPNEKDFVDLIAASLNQADDGVLKLPDQPLGLVRQKQDQPVLRFFADPGAEGSAWQLQLGDGDKPGFGLASADGKLALFVDGATGNVGIGVGAKKPEAALHIAGNLKVEAGSIKLDSNQKVFFMDNGQIGGRDQYHQLLFRCTEDITELREWGSIWLTAGNETCNNKPQIVVSQAEVKIGARLRISENNGTAANEVFGSLLLDHEDAGGASSIVFRSKVDQGSDYSFIEYKDQNPATQGVGASLLTIGNRNESNDHIALMPSGNVGIGTTTPGFKLDVNGDASISDGGSLLVLKGKEIFFSDNGQIRSLDNNHRILFRRDENKMELREYGDIIFSSGSTGGQETSRMVINRAGKVGVGTATPLGSLHVIVPDSGVFFEFPGKGTWVFQSDGNLVKYRADGSVAWALNNGW